MNRPCQSLLLIITLFTLLTEPSSAAAGTMDFQLRNMTGGRIQLRQTGNDSAYDVDVYLLADNWSWQRLLPAESPISPVWRPATSHSFRLPEAASKKLRPILVVFHDKSGVTYSAVLRIPTHHKAPKWPDQTRPSRSKNGTINFPFLQNNAAKTVRYGIIHPTDSSLQALKREYQRRGPNPITVVTEDLVLPLPPGQQAWAYAEWITGKKGSELTNWALIPFATRKESIMDGPLYWWPSLYWYLAGGLCLTAAGLMAAVGFQRRIIRSGKREDSR